MNITTNALRIGDEIQQTSLSYCEADNTYTPHSYTVQAWACPMRSRLPQPPEPADLFAAMFN